MKLRIEFIQSRSPAFKNTLRLARRVKTFKQFDEDGVTIYSIEFDLGQIQTFEAFRQITNWKGRAFYINGQLADRSQINQIVYEYIYKRNQDPREEWRRPGSRSVDSRDFGQSPDPQDPGLN